MADGGGSGVEELDPMEDIRHSVDEVLKPADRGFIATEPISPDGSFHDSESHDPPVSPGDTD